MLNTGHEGYRRKQARELLSNQAPNQCGVGQR